jgi:hypothetical protein
VPEDEKASVRNAVLQLMLSDPSDRVALQLGLLASNICAFDFPSRCVMTVCYKYGSNMLYCYNIVRMLSDPSDRVALQLGLLASNICAFDFPSRCVTCVLQVQK